LGRSRTRLCCVARKNDVFAKRFCRAVGVNELLMHQAAKYGVKLNQKSFAWHLGNEFSCDGVFQDNVSFLFLVLSEGLFFAC
jgi:hypothetical protein